MRTSMQMAKIVDDTGRFELIPYGTPKFMTKSMQAMYDDWAADFTDTGLQGQRPKNVNLDVWMGRVRDYSLPGTGQAVSVDKILDKVGNTGLQALDTLLGAGKQDGVYLGRLKAISPHDLDVSADRMFNVSLQSKKRGLTDNAVTIRVVEYYNGIKDLLHCATDGFRSTRSIASKNALILFTTHAARATKEKWVMDTLGIARFEVAE